MVACAVRPLGQAMPFDPGPLERVVHAQLVALAVTVNFCPPSIEKHAGAIIPQIEHHQVALDQIVMSKSRAVILRYLFPHYLHSVFPGPSTGFDFLVNGFPKWMRDDRDGLARRQEARHECMNIAQYVHDVRIDPDRDVVVGQQHMPWFRKRTARVGSS